MSGGPGAPADLADLARVCADLAWSAEPERAAAQLAAVLPGLRFERVLRRGGWHRIGGVVDASYGRVADQLDTWAERESGGDVLRLLDDYAGAGYFATRWQGVTHYLTAPCGAGAAEFVQLEVEELQEVLDRYLIDPDWYPDDLEEFVDPLDYPRLAPEPVGRPRFAFRRLLRVGDWLAEQQQSFGADNALPRWFADWDRSSAGAHAPMCRHWVMGLRESVDNAGAARLTGKPVPAWQQAPRLPGADALVGGADLANRLQAFDKAAGYPFAWYFHMLATPGVSFEVGEAVRADLAAGYTYLPERDATVLREWAQARYAP